MAYIGSTLIQITWSWLSGLGCFFYDWHLAQRQERLLYTQRVGISKFSVSTTWKDTRSNSKYGSNWFDSNLARWACYRVLFVGEVAEWSIALSLNLSGGDEPSIRSNRIFSSNFVPSLMVAANRFGYNIWSSTQEAIRARLAKPLWGRKIPRRCKSCLLRHSKMHHCKQYDSVHDSGHLA